ncbi:hypothetical protein DQ04_14961010 [Trypanosoma grayi]|uniref:hypothetical protein n=1 Tax=Trypanosoma grayi TaxID=71804 RepID=UPI0004F463B2|nr:hypothetical protein DQ04_14961010 [Trypanosoma grayi]KEG06260.1 hypothetical protein DQ04_14961010 [Trypanosoma grayi]
MQTGVLDGHVPSSKTSFHVSDSIGLLCPNVHCPHRTALEGERYTSMQLVAVNRVLEDGQRYLTVNNERLEVELRAKNHQLQQLDALATREAMRREELERQLTELQQTMDKRHGAAQCNVEAQAAELERLQQEKKLLVEQVLQLQGALDEMVRLNEALQFALQVPDPQAPKAVPLGVNKAVAEVEVVLPRSKAPRVDARRSRSSSAPSAFASNSGSLSSVAAGVRGSTHKPRHEGDDGDANDDIGGGNEELDTHINSGSGGDKDFAYAEDVQRGGDETAMHSMQNVVSDLAALRDYLNSLGPKS